jgi:hypothetical protein
MSSAGIVAHRLYRRGIWFAGPVAEDGALGGSEDFFLRAETPELLVAATPTPLPSEGVGQLQRISTANGLVFFHRLTTACVSFDEGLTWTACDNSLSSGGAAFRDVFWNGNKYYYDTVCSEDGITWTAIPNQPANSSVLLARDSDGAICSHQTDGTMWISLDDGATWDSKSFGSFTAPRPATDGERILISSNNGFLYYTDDLFDTVVDVSLGYQFSHSCWYARDTWLVFQYGSGGGVIDATGLRRSETGATWLPPTDAANWVLVIDNVDFDITNTATDRLFRWIVWYPDGDEFQAYTTFDAGETWSFLGTFYGPCLGLACLT